MREKKNYWEEIVRVFGFELGEEFNIIDENGSQTPFSPYKFTECGILDKDGDNASTILVILINDEYTIERLPWKPEYRDTYWCVYIGGDDVYKTHWSNDTTDHMRYKLGNYFKTREEAIKNKDKIIEMLQSDEVFVQ